MATPARPKRPPRATPAARAPQSPANLPITNITPDYAIDNVIDIANAQPGLRPNDSPNASAEPRGARLAGQNAVAEADFLDLAGHELRSPLTILKGQAQLLQRRMRREGEREADVFDLDKMLFQIERLNHQVGALLDATHLAQRRLTLVPEAIDLTPSVRRVVAFCVAGNPNITIQLETPSEPLIGHWDRHRIESVIRELLFNAIKYGGDDITIRLTREPDPTPGRGHSGEQARIEVEDHGIGVPARERSAIFGERARGSNAAHAGVGLGLYVARAIVRRHHGRIGVRPRAPKGPRGAPGSVFWVTLPLA